MKIAVLDVGGTAIKSGIWDGRKLTFCGEDKTETKKGGEGVLQCMKEILHRLHAEEADAIGISPAGDVNADTGTIHYANQNIPGYMGTEIGKVLEEEFKVPVAVENDVNAAALGEYMEGAGKGTNCFLCLTYGTGMGGGIVINGEVLEGKNWAAANFGGILIHPEKRIPGVQLSGCYETYASTTALVRSVTKVDPQLDNGRKIFEAIERSEIKEAVDHWIDEITYGLISLIHIFDPDKIALGGGIMAQKYVYEEVRRKTTERVENNFRDIQLVPAELGNSAGMMGAAYRAKEARLHKNLVR